jgi:pilus assembly protein CpaE
LLASQKRLVVAAQEIVLISDLTLAGIRDTLRIKSALTALGCTARLTIVAARTNSSGEGHITRAVFEKGVQASVDIVLPQDDAVIAEASNNGKALGESAPRASLTKAIRELALRFINTDGIVQEKAKPGFLAKLLGDTNGKKKKSTRSKK